MNECRTAHTHTHAHTHMAHTHTRTHMTHTHTHTHTHTLTHTQTHTHTPCAHLQVYAWQHAGREWAVKNDAISFAYSYGGDFQVERCGDLLPLMLPPHPSIQAPGACVGVGVAVCMCVCVCACVCACVCELAFARDFMPFMLI